MDPGLEFDVTWLQIRSLQWTNSTLTLVTLSPDRSPPLPAPQASLVPSPLLHLPRLCCGESFSSAPPRIQNRLPVWLPTHGLTLSFRIMPEVGFGPAWIS
ncbi:Kelch repeat and BTB domain-containing protein 5 [Platysternon megacephalum]|uniref:Kelch repeat and BTB domain-containing protein 5 n=1 Tax=Platysternon megacephalum TaxID=55544 RepID=A0A4D9EWM1_9SAUR|nr:Kelch repeat and BTB domain-containing protein 5 [Platysternon megacephalum]